MRQELPDAAADRVGRRAGGPRQEPESPDRAPLEDLMSAEVSRFLNGGDLDTGSDEEEPIPDDEARLPEHVRQVHSEINAGGFAFTCDLCGPSGLALNSGSQVQNHAAGKRHQKKLKQLTAGTLQLAE